MFLLCQWNEDSRWKVSDLWKAGGPPLPPTCSSCDEKLLSDLGRGRLSRCSALPRGPGCIDSSELDTWSACSASAFTTALIVLLSGFCESSSLCCATIAGFFPILFSLKIQRLVRYCGRAIFYIKLQRRKHHTDYLNGL